MMQKMKVDSVAELVDLFISATKNSDLHLI